MMNSGKGKDTKLKHCEKDKPIILGTFLLTVHHFFFSLFHIVTSTMTFLGKLLLGNPTVILLNSLEYKPIKRIVISKLLKLAFQSFYGFDIILMHVRLSKATYIVFHMFSDNILQKGTS